MLSPKKTKYKKYQKGTIKGIETRVTKLAFGTYGLQSTDCGRITARQIESARKAIIRQVKKTGKLWIRIFPDIPVTAKPAEVRMGKGKGYVEYWAARVKPGRILFEIEGVPTEIAEQALKYGASKLPVRTKFIKDHDITV